ncbi:hypothetical protein FPRO03_10412 [Fusarium proliferatum]|nr:hypothetical protein FPRO03_10412 [Fusarium proliferatum]
MELANDLCSRTQECVSLFQSTSGHRALADNDWFEDRAADFAWWAHGLKAQKTGRSSLDYRLRERLDVKRVIAGLLDSLALALKEYLQPDKSQGSIRRDPDDEDDKFSESEKSSSGSSWSELSDKVEQPEDNDAAADNPDNENSDPRFYIETNLKLLAKISIAIRRSGQRLRYLKADAYLRDHLDDEEYRLLRNHLLFLILVGSYEQKLFTELRRLAISQEIPKAVEIVIRSWIIDPSRATSTQQGLIEANIVRRNRIAYARRFIGKDVVPKRPQEDNATTIAPSQLPEALLVSAREASTFGTKEPLPIPSPAQPLPDPLEPAKPLTAKTLTATELGSQFILPIIMPLEPKRGAMSILTKITQTGTNQDYPACPAKKGSFQCPYCVQVLPEDYATKSRWRGHVAQDLNPYSCIYRHCPDSGNLYATKEEWNNHIRNKHNKERWACDDYMFESDHGDEFIFDSHDSWASHMRHRHNFSEDRLTLLSNMSKRDLNESVQCPLCKRPCGYSRPDQDDHISEHLHSWALRALPWDLNPDDDASSDSPEMGSENDLARMSDISEQSEDEVESVTATISNSIDREVTRWRQEKPIGSSRLDVLVKELEEVIAKWMAHTWLDTQNEIMLQLLININQVKAQFCRASRAELEERELTTQQQQDIEENLCTNIELGMDYMNGLIGERDIDPSQDPKEWPNSSPFPKINDTNIPLNDEEKLEILWNARHHVLHSNNVSMQITWARDALTWIQISQEDRAREKKYNVNSRPETPGIEHELIIDATNIITHLADQEHPEALYMRSKWLEFGILGNRVDKQEAYSGYSRAAALGHGRSKYRCGVLHEQSNDMLTAKRHYYRGLAVKDSASLYRMGMMSLLGQHGEIKDQIIGLERMKASADSSDEDAPQGSYVYGALIARELPDTIIPEDLLPHDPSTAKIYLEKSAYLGFAKAQAKLGQAYELCHLGCDFNPSYSLHYYGLAAKQGIPEASMGVSRWFLFGSEGAFAKNEALAYKYAQQAAAGEFAIGEFAMGYYNEIGIHVQKDLAEARRWYQLSADHGNDDAVDAILRLQSLDKGEKARQDRNPKAIPLASQTFGETRSKVVDQTRLEPVSKPKTIIVGIDLGAVFSSVSWADSSNPYEIYVIHDWPHAAAISASDGQVPTQYDLETKLWGNPRMQAARLRKSVNIAQKNCFSALEDFCSGVEPARKQATRFLTSYIGTLWNHVVHEILSKTEGWDLEFILSLSIPVYFSWEMENRLLRMARDTTAHNGASKVVEVNAIGQLQAVILNSLKDQYRLNRSARGPSVVMENGEIVVICDCGGTGARALSYEVHTESPPLVQQLTSWNAENFGTPSVDMEFINYLLNHSSSNLGTSRSALNELDFFIETEWEYGLKRTFRGDDNHDIILQLPRKAISALKRLQPSSSRLLIKPNVVRKFFEKSLMAIEKVIDAQFAALEVIGRKPNSILLVGGLAQSPYIIQQLQQKFDVIFHLPYEMAQVLVVYPSGPSFDLDYYLTKHMPLVASKWGSYGLKNYKIITFQEGAPFQVQATLEWESLEVFEKAAASEAAAAVFGDIKNFYDGNPVLLKGPVVASETVASS